MAKCGIISFTFCKAESKTDGIMPHFQYLINGKRKAQPKRSNCKRKTHIKKNKIIF